MVNMTLNKSKLVMMKRVLTVIVKIIYQKRKKKQSVGYLACKFVYLNNEGLCT